MDVPLLEYCSMQFLKDVLGLNVPETRLINVGVKTRLRLFDLMVRLIHQSILFLPTVCLTKIVFAPSKIQSVTHIPIAI